MILLVNGPNLNLLGEREPAVYGRETLADVERLVSEACAAYGREVKAFQSNWEGALIDFLQQHRHQAEGVIVNPGALTHTSRALHDCLKALPCPAVEVHISNIHAREAWRRESVVAPAALGQITGLGVAGYYYAALHLCSRLAAETAAGTGAEGARAGGASAEPYAGAQPPRPMPPPRPAPLPRASPPRGAEPSLGAEHGRQAYRPSDLDSDPDGKLVPAAPGEEIPVDVNARGDYEPL